MHPLATAIAVPIVAIAALQLVPYGHARANPPVRSEPAWDSPQTRALAVRACYACHSNETVWPWYGQIAPVSWLIQRDVDLGRRALNFSEGGRGHEGGSEAGESLADGEMPPSLYLLMYPEARLSSAEKRALSDGLRATLGGEIDEDEGK